jgi:hypothetical protein
VGGEPVSTTPSVPGAGYDVLQGVIVGARRAGLRRLRRESCIGDGV